MCWPPPDSEISIFDWNRSKIENRKSKMLATGVDILHVPRVAEALERYGQRFLERVYTAEELTYCGGRVPALAVRFAAKEAVSKALGVGMRVMSRDGIGFHEAEVVNGESGKPHVRLHGRAAELAEELGLTHWSLSLSHEREYAVAFVVAT
jgi:holo-[acyl-carrier protein] synthase